MSTSYFRFVFSDLPLSVTVALPFEVKDDDLGFYNIMWGVIEYNFRTSRSNLIAFTHITEDDFENCLLKVDFRDK